MAPSLPPIPCGDSVMAWTPGRRPPCPTCPAAAAPLRLYDTADRRGPRDHRPRRRRPACTSAASRPYDATHLGHAATYLAFDLVQRVWRDAGHAVHYVQNVTDVDDPLLERAGAHRRELDEPGRARDRAVPRGHDGAARARRRTTTSARSRRCRRSPRRSSELLASGAAYYVGRGHLLPTSPATSTSATSRTTTARRCCALFAERGGDPDRAGKRDPLDSLLWRGHRYGEPFWDTALGPGRPGWHIECSVIALNRLGHGLRRAGRRLRPDLPAPRALAPRTPRR